MSILEKRHQRLFKPTHDKDIIGRSIVEDRKEKTDISQPDPELSSIEESTDIHKIKYKIPHHDNSKKRRGIIKILT